jgi:hypothetical protein
MMSIRGLILDDPQHTTFRLRTLQFAARDNSGSDWSDDEVVRWQVQISWMETICGLWAFFESDYYMAVDIWNVTDGVRGKLSG